MHSEWPWWMKVVLFPVSIKWRIEDALKKKPVVKGEEKVPPDTRGS